MSFFSKIKLARLIDFGNVTTISDPTALHAVQLSLRKGGGRGEGAELFQGFPNSSEGGSRKSFKGGEAYLELTDSQICSGVAA